MPISITCTACQTDHKVPRGAAGKRVKCPKCGTPIPVPDAAPTARPHARRGGSSRQAGSEFRSAGYASRGRWTLRTVLKWVGLWALALAAVWVGLRTFVRPPPMLDG